jgi:RNA-directed DNA polymerase
VVQAAVLLILEPIFEADFEDCSYGFRPGRNAHQTLEEIRENLRAGKCEIYDADLQGYFDSIPHDKLMACVQMRVVDGSVLKLIRQWLRAPVVEEDQQGDGTRSGQNLGNDVGQARMEPLPELIGELNRHLKGWTNYYRLGQPRQAFQRLNRYVRQQLYQRLRRSSQRPWKAAPAQTAYGYFKELGLIYL